MVESPCINVCKLDEARTLCVGCLRTLDELRAWREASDEEKLAIIAKAKQRQTQMHSQAA